MTLFQGDSCIRNLFCKLCHLVIDLDSCPSRVKRCMVATYIKKIMHNMICVTGL